MLSRGGRRQGRRTEAMRSLVHLASLAGTLGVGCAMATPGGHPHAMSAAAHEHESDEHAHMAGQHAADYNPSAITERLSCAPGRASGGPGADPVAIEGICWTSISNATAEHQAAAEQHRRHAADHRAASVALREAEARACAGIAAPDRDASPFQHTEDIVRVTPLVLNEFDARTARRPEKRVGAVVTFRAVPGLTAEWLQRVVDCHLARNAALGHAVPEVPDCPLVPAGVEARVSAAEGGFSVAIQSSDPKVAREILARAERLAATTPDGSAAPR